MITGYDLYGDLPLFPSFTQKPNDERLEREVERLMDRADVRFLAGKATQTQYDAWIKALDNWANAVRS